MNTVFSLWTGTTTFRLHRGDAMVATLAIALANRHMPIDFHTDDYGFDIAHELGWNFRGMYHTLDFLPNSVPKEVWSFGKLFVLSRSLLPTIHVDLDVLL